MSSRRPNEYLGTSVLLHREAVARGAVHTPRLRHLVDPARVARAYGISVLATLALVAAMFAAAFALQAASGGRFVLFGHDVPPVDPATGRVLDRPGSILLAYYLLGFGGLLVHYLQDTVCFLRRRPVEAPR